MTRKLRVQYPGAIYHVMSRGLYLGRQRGQLKLAELGRLSGGVG